MEEEVLTIVLDRSAGVSSTGFSATIFSAASAAILTCFLSDLEPFRALLGLVILLIV